MWHSLFLPIISCLLWNVEVRALTLPPNTPAPRQIQGNSSNGDVGTLFPPNRKTSFVFHPSGGPTTPIAIAEAAHLFMTGTEVAWLMEEHVYGSVVEISDPAFRGLHSLVSFRLGPASPYTVGSIYLDAFTTLIPKDVVPNLKINMPSYWFSDQISGEVLGSMTNHAPKAVMATSNSSSLIINGTDVDWTSVDLGSPQQQISNSASTVTTSRKRRSISASFQSISSSSSLNPGSPVSSASPTLSSSAITGITAGIDNRYKIEAVFKGTTVPVSSVVYLVFNTLRFFVWHREPRDTLDDSGISPGNTQTNMIRSVQGKVISLKVTVGKTRSVAGGYLTWSIVGPAIRDILLGPIKRGGTIFETFVAKVYLVEMGRQEKLPFLTLEVFSL